ncbi:MAG: MMPL family transporter [Candidatus Nealsonbacteria bacterium]|nr:MMPL family transporter [Candidatus Nealsonbacteria bacterium]
MSQPTHPSFYARYAWPLMAVLVALIPLTIQGVVGTFQSANNNVAQWLPQNSKEVARYDRFRGRFGADDFALVSWDGCTLDDPNGKLELFARKVAPPPELAGKDDRARWFTSVVTGPRVLKMLTEEPLNLSRKEAIERLQGTLVGLDGKMTCALVTLSTEGNDKQTAALDALQAIAVDDCAVRKQDLRLGGNPIANAAIDIESEKAVRQWIIFSWAITLGMAWWSLRSWKLMSMIFVVAGYSSLMATALIHYTGGTMNLVLVVVPVLIYVLPLSAAVHLANYYRDAIREAGSAGAPVRAMLAGWTPCALSAVTTALGLVSLCVSNIVPVKMFGVYSALGILLSLPMLFGLLPVMMETWPFSASPSAAGSSGGATDRWLRRLAGGIVRRHRPTLAICLAVLTLVGAGVVYIDTTVAPGRFFSPKSRWMLDGAWLQEQLGAVVPFEVEIRFDRDPSKIYDRMELVRRAAAAVGDVEQVGETISAATFCPSFQPRRSQGGPQLGNGGTGRAFLKVFGAGDGELIKRNILNKRLQRHRRRFLETDYFTEDKNGKYEYWRISARVRGSKEIDYGRFTSNIEDRLDRFRQAEGESAKNADVTLTGMVPLVFLAQRELFDGLVRSFCLAFAMIAVVMVLLLRSVSAGLLVMIPNVFPAMVTFGTMGWTNSPVDVGAMMTASVALGIAVDDTLHYLTWFRRALDGGHSRRAAIIEAFLRCAPAMTQTTLIAGLGLLVFCFCSFQPIAQFGLLMFILLTAALVGDLVLLPAMLASRLGKCFQRRKKKGE